MRIYLSPAFKRSVKRLQRGRPDITGLLASKLERFKANPFDPVLKNHKLHGDLKHLRSIWIDSDLRVVYEPLENGNVLLQYLGSHDEVY